MKFRKFLAVALSAMSLMQTAYAEEQFIKINGFAEKGVLGVVTLMVDKGANLKDLTSKQIHWIDQAKVSENGAFSVYLPVYNPDEYDFYSNALTYQEDDPENKTKSFYVSSSGSDANTGENPSEPLKTLAAAYRQIDMAKEIVLLDDMAFVNIPKEYKGKLTIKGNDSNVILTLNGDVNLKGNLTFENLTINGSKTIYANGYELVVKESVSTPSSRLTVYGGKNGADLDGDTNVTLLGGRYQTIYGGGNCAGVNGDTNVTVGGNVNSGDGIDDTVSSISPCYVYGAGNDGAVSGKTNITLQDNATVKYLVGAGSYTNGTATDTNIYINGGQVMNVYGGTVIDASVSGKSVSTILPDGTTTHITMTGGVAEALFGGCENVALNGHTFVTVTGGEVTRRVYTGCYNNLTSELKWDTNNYVTGTTTLSIGPDATFNTMNNGTLNVGVFSGSRMENQNDNEANTVIYLDDCYNSKKGVIGEKTSKDTGVFGITLPMSTWLKSFEDYTVKAGKNGMVFGTTTAKTVYVAPDKGFYGVLNGKKYENENVAITNGASITFEEYDFAITDVAVNKSDAEISADVDLIAKNKANETAPKMYAAVYDETGKLMLDVNFVNTTADMNEHSFDFDYTFEKDKTYLVKVMMWNANGKPLTSQYSFIVK